MFIVDKIKEYFGLLDDIAVDFLKDIKSLRYQLILLVFAFNVYIIIKTPENIKFGIGLLTAVYAFYFASKHFEHHSKAETIESLDPPTRLDPDDL